MGTLFERIGQEEGLKSLIRRFYQKVLIDPKLAPFFSGHDIEQLMSHQHKFLGYALGATDSYQGRSLFAVHEGLVKKMGLSDEHFDLIVQYLKECLVQLKVGTATTAQILLIIESTRDEILNNTNQP